MGDHGAFHDQFSDKPRAYAQSRPTYPAELFGWLATLTPRGSSVWDCATGNGQAAVELASRFDRVVATDASASQLEHAARRDNIDYRVATAESSGLDDSSVGLVTIAQALHWFDFDKFWNEVRRVLKPGGVVCAWCYALHRIEPAIDEVIDRFYRGPVDPYWLPQRDHVDALYATIPFPFERVETPSFEMRLDWTREQCLAYLRTWSATKRFEQDKGYDPVASIEDELRELWPDGEIKPVHWPMGVLAGRV
ncbi:MAG: methyltransferase domain-containing protein [Phycisphaeraceae bacterium]|nr:methyltransferase domain-containing protein [Phycisphaeraceae bacterium]